MQIETNTQAPVDAGIEVETNLPQDIAPEAVKEQPQVEEDDEAEDPEDESGEEAQKPKLSRRKAYEQRLKTQIATQAQQIADLLAKAPKVEEVKQADNSTEPQISDFTDVLDYVKAHNKWEVSQQLKGFQETQETKVKTEQEERVYQEKVSKYNEKLQPVLKEIPDFPERIQELMDAGLVTANVENAVLDSDAPEMVSVYLVANPQELQAMQGMTEKQVYRAIALIEAKITKDLQPDTQTGKKTTATAPINPVGKKAATSTKSPLESDDMSDWYAYEAKLKRPSR